MLFTARIIIMGVRGGFDEIISREDELGIALEDNCN
jgi:hypothetical protein